MPVGRSLRRGRFGGGRLVLGLEFTERVSAGVEGLVLSVYFWRVRTFGSCRT